MNPIQLRSEQLVLYALLMHPNLVYEIMSKVSVDMLQDPTHKVIFEAAVELYVINEPIDTISVYKSVLKQSSMYKEQAASEITKLIGGVDMFSGIELMDAIRFLTSESVRHEHQDLGTQIIQMSNADDYDPINVLDFIQEHIHTNKFKSLLKKKEFSNEDLLEELEKKMEEARNKEGINGIETGYTEFDKLTSGMQPTNLIIVAARPAMGKTQLALGIMKHASIKNNNKGVFFSCEMAEVQVMKRIVAIEGEIRGYSIKYGNLTHGEWAAYAQAKKKIVESNLKILAGSWTINDIVAKTHELSNSEGLDYLVVDYVQKVHGSDKANRNNEVEEVTGKLKDLANELEIPVVALAQLSRAVEQRPDKRPMLSDLRDSGAIEQDADIVAFLYRPSYYMEEHEKADNPLAKDGYMMIAKHRDGDLRDIQMRFEEDIPAWRNLYDPPVVIDKQEEMSFDRPSPLQPSSNFDNEDNDLPF